MFLEFFLTVGVLSENELRITPGRLVKAVEIVLDFFEDTEGTF